ncbi:MAG TPA: DivIVA domain-containing protein [Thermoleophilaceae bacterium]|nr:DivIVA domain-containing protein [Thermoleophilaceae bacterium]
MELDRRYITRRDFPAARRGYDPDEVDQHLRDLADAIEDLRREADRPVPVASVAGAAAEQVRSIVEAAERSAAEIEQRAELDARRVLETAEDDARATRMRADSEAADHVSRVEDATRAMLERADAAEGQVAQLLEGLRATADSMVTDLRNGAEQLGRELGEIRRGLGDVSSARPAPTETQRIQREEPQPAAEPEYREPEPEYREPEPAYQEPEPVPEPVPESQPEPVPEPQPEYHQPEPEEESLKVQGDELHPGDVHAPAQDFPPAPEREPFQPEAEPETLPDLAPEPTPQPAASGGGGGGAGSEGARLIALNMALNGTPREETAAYLRDNFDLPDQDALLDEVYSRAGG